MKYPVLLPILLILMALPERLKAECECPPIEVFYDYCYGVYPMATSFVVVGGCAELEQSAYQVEHFTQNETWVLGALMPGEQTAVSNMSFSSVGDSLRVYDSNSDCVQSFRVPFNPGYSENFCPYAFDCESMTLSFAPDDAIYPDSIGLSDTIEIFDVKWTAANGCPVSETVVMACNVQDCPEASFERAENSTLSYDTYNCMGTNVFFISGTYTTNLLDAFVDYWGPNCFFDFSHSYAVDGVPLNSYEPPVDLYWDDLYRKQVILTYPLSDEPLEVEVTDNLSGCVYTFEITPEWDCESLCDCDNFEMRSSHVCDPETGIVQGIYHFNNDCTDTSPAPSFEVSFEEQNFVVSDSLVLQHAEGDPLLFPEVSYFDRGNLICSASFDLGVVDTDCAGSNNEHQLASSVGVHSQNGAIQLHFAKPDSKMHWQIYTLEGRLRADGVCNQKFIEVPAGDWKTGLHLLRIAGEEATFSKAFFLH